MLPSVSFLLLALHIAGGVGGLQIVQKTGAKNSTTYRIRAYYTYPKYIAYQQPPPTYQEANRIAGGYFAYDAQFPFMAVVHRLLERNSVSQCGGTVISKRWVLTAGHCVTTFPSRFLVVFGIINKSGIGYDYNVGPGVSMLTYHSYVHSRYSQTMNDVGLLYMPQDIPYTSKIKPIRLAGYYESGETFADEIGYIIGWGRQWQGSMGSKDLKYALLPIIENRECSKYWFVDQRNICTAPGLGHHACQGDSGGPLIVIRDNEMIQVGIVSYGDADCPSERPGVFTRVTAFNSWIESVTGLQF